MTQDPTTCFVRIRCEDQEWRWGNGPLCRIRPSDISLMRLLFWTSLSLSVCYFLSLSLTFTDADSPVSLEEVFHLFILPGSFVTFSTSWSKIPFLKEVPKRSRASTTHIAWKEHRSTDPLIYWSLSTDPLILIHWSLIHRVVLLSRIDFPVTFNRVNGS